ncbi:N-acetylmuramate alpha-1-phosphate uridylyltransferase MurU [Cellvibrio sp. NN19]|uniref:N-acetylmuramate alpha-1-phosphate uridylyltransferase MurU n=1 Tax=Cellvibrio chitinivorans TaxID=3102792 RepID=UPI002B405EC9|nr:nucleotidyltransferase family protein [Cellvibrio sp. NN19]
MKAMILAAGLGNRMRPLTDHTPKPLLCAGGKPLIEYHLENLQRAGIREVIINLAYLGEKIRAHLGDGQQFGLQIHYSTEPEPLETGGAILHALDLLGDEPFLLINGDVWCDLEFAHLVQHPLTENQQGHLLLVPNPDFHPLGDFALADNGLLLDDLEKTHPQRFTFGGISLLKPELINNYPDKRQKFPLVEVLRRAIGLQQLSGEVHNGHWSDVGTPTRLQDLENYLQG